MYKVNLEISAKSVFFSRLQAVKLHLDLRRDGDSKEVPVATLFKELLFAVPALRDINWDALGRAQSALTLTDLRGRPAESFPKQTELKNPVSKHTQEELLYLEGRILIPSDSNSDNETDSLPFSAKMHTEFLKFEGTSHIVHSLHSYLDETLKPLPSALLFTRPDWVVPLEIDCARLGYELFKARQFGSMLGLMPRIVERCYLSLGREGIEVFFEVEIEKRDRIVAVLNDPFIKALDKSLREHDVYGALDIEIERKLKG